VHEIDMHGMRPLTLLLRSALVVTGLLAVPQPALASDCSRTSVGHDALPDLVSSTYKGEPGGLYVGTNEPPAAYAEAGRRAGAQVVPLDAQGKPSASGKVVLLSIGMSNTTQEFSAFVTLARTDAMRAASVVVVDGAQGGQDARVWAKADAQVWSIADQRLQASGVSAAQVEAVWLKQAVAGPRGDFPTSTRELTDLLDSIVRAAAQRYPQLRQVFLSPRTYAGYATTSLNPEPYAFESGFADRALVMRSVASPDARPWIGWGPYLWTDGTRGRSDGFVWTCADTRESDGTHPSPSGQQKVAQLLQAFVDSSPFTAWYRGASTIPSQSPGPGATAAPTSRAAPIAAPTVPAATESAPIVAGAEDRADRSPLVFLGAAVVVLFASTALLVRMRKP
jgi:hypothetical protein